MSFIVIEPLSLGHGKRPALTNVVRCRGDGAALQVVIAADVAARVGLVAGSRATCSLGIGTHSGKLAISPSDAANTYKVQKNGKSGGAMISIGARHFGINKRPFTTLDASFEIAGDTLIVTIPTMTEMLKAARQPSASLNSNHAAA